MGQNSELQIQDRENQSLYQIRQDHYELMKMVEDAEGEITEEVDAALTLTKDNLKAKSISYGFVIKSYDDKTDLIDKEIKRLQDLKQKSTKKSELFKQKISEGLQQFGIQKVETPTLKLSLRKSESIEIVDEEKIPKDFIEEKVSYVISKTKIKDSIRDGILVPGAELKTNYNLQIK